MSVIRARKSASLQFVSQNFRFQISFFFAILSILPEKCFENSKQRVSRRRSSMPVLQLFTHCTFDILRVSAHRHFVFLQNFVKSSLGRIFAKDLRFFEQLLQKIKVNTIAEEGRI